MSRGIEGCLKSLPYFVLSSDSEVSPHHLVFSSVARNLLPVVGEDKKGRPLASLEATASHRHSKARKRRETLAIARHNNRGLVQKHF